MHQFYSLCLLKGFFQLLLVKAKQPLLSCGKHLLIDNKVLFSIIDDSHLFDSYDLRYLTPLSGETVVEMFTHVGLFC